MIEKTLRWRKQHKVGSDISGVNHQVVQTIKRCTKNMSRRQDTFPDPNVSVTAVKETSNSQTIIDASLFWVICGFYLKKYWRCHSKKLPISLKKEKEK